MHLGVLRQNFSQKFNYRPDIFRHGRSKSYAIGWINEPKEYLVKEGVASDSKKEHKLIFVAK